MSSDEILDSITTEGGPPPLSVQIVRETADPEFSSPPVKVIDIPRDNVVIDPPPKSATSK